MRIYQPTNEFGQALLNQGQLVATSMAITKGVSDAGTITLTSSDIPGIADWDVRSVSVVINKETMSFQPEIKREASGSIVITFHKAGETIEGLGDATIVLSLVNSDGFIQVLTIEQKIAKAIASHDAAQIRAVAAEAKATGEDKYRFATCETDTQLLAAGFVADSYNGENLMCLVDSNTEGDCAGLFFEASITSFNTPLPMLTNGFGMFHSCTNLMSFTGDLPSLTNSENMFYQCYTLTSFTGNMPALENGNSMFRYCNYLTSFTGDLSSLTDGGLMFDYCEKLTTWDVALPKLTNGNSMFQFCYNLTSFTGDLSSLTTGEEMFSRCKLDQASVDRILASINNLASQGKTGTLTLGVASGVVKRTSEFLAKGWRVN